MSRQIGIEDLEDIARGAAILGAGGGGDPYLGRLLAENAIRTYGPVTLVDMDELTDDAMVLPVAIMGAPTVIVERIQQWGPEGFEERLAKAWAGFIASTGWLKVTELAGAEAVSRAWAELAAGHIDPAQGLVARL